LLPEFIEFLGFPKSYLSEYGEYLPFPSIDS